MQLGPGVIAQQPKCGILTLLKKGPCQDWQSVAKSPSSGISPLNFNPTAVLKGLSGFSLHTFRSLMGFTIDSVPQTCWCFGGTSAEAADETCWFSAGFPHCWCGTAYSVYLCAAESLKPQGSCATIAKAGLQASAFKETQAFGLCSYRLCVHPPQQNVICFFMCSFICLLSKETKIFVELL